MIICYLTNPIVVLFADKVGELKGFWHYWQTWDDTLDSQYMMTEVIPKKFSKLDYGWSDKYEPYQDTETLKEYNAVINRVKLKKYAKFSKKEKLQRYLCRVLWITRNCAYGFAHDIFNAKGDLKDITFWKYIDYGDGDHFHFCYDKSKNILVRPWACRFYKRVFGNFYITGNLGWKIPYWHREGKYCAMIANRVVPRFKPNND